MIGDAYERGKAEGIAEGRRQAAEGVVRKWGVGREGTSHVIRVEDESHAREVADDLRCGHYVVSRLLGPWEPAEQPEGSGT